MGVKIERFEEHSHTKVRVLSRDFWPKIQTNSQKLVENGVLCILEKKLIFEQEARIKAASKSCKNSVVKIFSKVQVCPQNLDLMIGPY